MTVLKTAVSLADHTGLAAVTLRAVAVRIEACSTVSKLPTCGSANAVTGTGDYDGSSEGCFGYAVPYVGVT